MTSTKRPKDGVRKASRRLPDFNYIGRYRYLITICTYKGKTAFRYPVTTRDCIKNLRELSAKYEFDIICYCFMPNHLHVLAKGKSDTSDLRNFIRIYKQITSYYHKQKTGYQLWQRGFDDRVLRNSEDSEEVCSYTMYNPVRRNIVKNSYYKI